MKFSFLLLALGCRRPGCIPTGITFPKPTNPMKPRINPFLRSAALAAEPPAKSKFLAMICFAFLFCLITQQASLATDLTESQRPSAEALKAMHYGIFIHNVYRGSAAPEGVKYNNLDEFANLFDVREFANQMEAIGVEYVFFTGWHASMYCLGPNAAMDKWLPGHTSKRDLIGDLADALNVKGIKLVIYAHPNDGHDLTAEEQAKVGYIKGYIK